MNNYMIDMRPFNNCISDRVRKIGISGRLIVGKITTEVYDDVKKDVTKRIYGRIKSYKTSWVISNDPWLNIDGGMYDIVEIELDNGLKFNPSSWSVRTELWMEVVS